MENKEPIYDSGRMIMEDDHLALLDGMKFSTRRHLAPYGLEAMELQHDGRKLDAAGALYVSLMEYKAKGSDDAFTSVDTP